MIGLAFVLLAAASPTNLTPRGARVETEEVAGDMRNFGNLRAGVTPRTQRPELCLEIAPLADLSLESCGTGSGFLHHDPEPELAHFRGKYRLRSWTTSWGRIETHAALGFAELQIGDDSPGFQFGGTGSRGVETAGPEIGGSVRVLLPLTADFELLGEASTSAAWMPHAPKLVKPMSRFQPDASLTVGVGF